MTSLFFYGTLRHVPLLSIVLGRSADSLLAQDGELPDHWVNWAAGQVFPMIRARKGGSARGLLVEGLSPEDVQRLNFYEGGFAYDLAPVTIQTGNGRVATEVYFPEPGLWQPGDDWILEDWEEKWAALSCEAATEVMSYFGQRDAAEVASMFPMIRARALSRLKAGAGSNALSPSGYTGADVRETARTRPYARYFAMEEIDLRHRRYDGAMSQEVKRAVFVASDAAIVLPYDPRRDRVLLIEQFRAGPHARGDDLPWQLEPVAGRIDPGETPEETAHREAAEEAGLRFAALHEVAHCYASPGCTTEYYDIYVGEADLPDSAAVDGGLDNEAEDIRAYLFSFDQLMAMVDTMQAANAPLVLAALWLARHRDRLRAGA